MFSLRTLFAERCLWSNPAMPIRRIVLALLIVALAPLASAPAGAQAESPRFRILVFTKTAAFRHSSIPVAVAAVQQLGRDNGFDVAATEDATLFTEQHLATFDAVMFLSTTGDILNARQQGAFERYIQSGGGFIGVHAAADTEYDWPFYGRMLGTWFDSHPRRQNGRLVVADRSHPSTAHLPARWERYDEWYNFRANPRGKVHVLMTLDERSIEGVKMGGDHPIAWCRDFGSSRVWYTGLGHTEESYAEPAFLRHLLGGIETAAGAIGADCRGTVWKNFERDLVSPDAVEPMSLAPAPDGSVLFVERGGALKRWDPTSGATSVIGTLAVRTSGEHGLLGIALDPAFAANGRIFLFYAPKGTPVINRVSRFTLEGGELDPASEVVLLEIPTEKGCCHVAGSLAFGADGNLYVSTGDATKPFPAQGYAPIDERPGYAELDAQRTASNTNDLRGKILRIRPLDDGTYDIPVGNLFPPGAPNTRPEIYAMGLRNPFRFTVDDAGVLHVGDIGPDAARNNPERGPRGVDELNRTVEAVNFGWPYCVGKNKPYRDYDFATGRSGAPFDCASPVNDSANSTGIRSLPPAAPAWISYPYKQTPRLPAVGRGPRAAMAGPVYPATGGSFPEYYDGVFFAYDWARGRLFEVRHDEAGDFLVLNAFLGSRAFRHPIDVELGADGSLWVLDFGKRYGSGPDAGLYRVRPDAPSPAPSVATART